MIILRQRLNVLTDRASLTDSGMAFQIVSEAVEKSRNAPYIDLCALRDKYVLVVKPLMRHLY